MKKKKKVYFAHPMASYGSRREKAILAFIKDSFYSSEIVNPNSSFHEKACKIIGFKYFPLLVSSCDILVAIPHKDGRFGSGTYQEILAAVDAGLKIYTVEKYPGYSYRIVPLSYKEIIPLSIEETKLHRKKMRG